MITKQEIIEAIQRTAKENGGNPLGVDRFAKETGIKPYDWGKFWVRFSEAQKEAGFESNQINIAYTDEFLIKKIISIARKLGKFPTYREIDFERGTDPELPDKGAFYRLGSKEQLAIKVKDYCENKKKYEDIVEFCRSIIENAKKSEDFNDKSSQMIGEVYLFKSGRYYKIGKTIDTVRRGSEIRVQLPERTDLVHVIKTDDPSGIEAYWHRRFESKRMNGEWFDLNMSDVKAFKRWRRIV